MKLHYICARQERMKNMTPEIYTTLSILLLCWIVLLATDAAVCGILKLAAGIPFKKAFLWGCLSLLIPPFAITYGSLIERNWFKVEHVVIEHEELPAGFDGYTIVHISDLHARSFEGREKHLQRVVEKINATGPDIIAFTGDLISMSPDELEGMTGILGELKATDGVFSVLGNHDYCMYSNMDRSDRNKALEQLIHKEEGMGWTLLMNENVTITRDGDSVTIVGVENTSPSRHFPSKGDLSRASEGTDGLFRILLSHDPLHWESEIIGKDYPLTLSGHTHSMQFSLFGWSPSRYLFPQYRGLYSTENGQHIYVNTGLGETIFPARIGVRPEITLITLKNRNCR